MMKKHLILLSCLTAMTCAQGALIVGFNDGTTAQAGASTLDPGLASATMAFGAGLSKTDTATNAFYVGGDPVGSVWTLQDALDNDYYYSISITPSAGNAIDFTSLTVSTFSQNDDRVFYLLSDIGGFTTGSVISNYTETTNSSGTGGSTASHTLDLTDAAFDSVTGPIEFRVYFTNDVTPNTFEDSGFKVASGSGENFVAFDGVVAIPEPSAYAALAGLLAVGLVVWRRKR